MPSNRPGRLIILSSPSGCGKTTVYKRLLAEIPSLAYSVSTTTRPMRKGETDGKDYFFVTPEKFRELIRQKAFLEWEKVYGRYYGTRRDLVEGLLAGGQDCIMDLDVKGGRKLKKARPDSLAVFLLPPSFPVLRKRLEGRATDHPREIERRFREAVHELKYCPDYDYIMVNDDLEDVIAKMKKLIRKEA